MTGPTPEPISLLVNGRHVAVSVGPATPLLSVLRADLGLVGPRFGCGLGQCGACMVIVGGEVRPSCNLAIGDVGSRSVITIEGLAGPDGSSAVQSAIVDAGAGQCGYCLSGIVVAATALLAAEPAANEARVRDALAGNLCRCGVHGRVLRAVAGVAGPTPDDGRSFPPAVTGGADDPGAGPAAHAAHAAVPGPMPEPRPLAEPDLPPLPPSDRVDGWLHADLDGTVWIRTGKVELGQGIHEALAILVAEELGLPFEWVRVAPPDTARSRDEGTTAGSRSVHETGRHLRTVAATARRELIATAARWLECDPDQVRLDGDRWRGPAGGPSASTFELVARGAWATPVDEAIALVPAGRRRLIGTSPVRRDLRPKVHGAPAFIQDLLLPGMLHGRVVRPPEPGATLRAVDAERIRALPGVTGVVVDGSFVGLVAEREDQAMEALELSRRVADWAPAPPRHDPSDPNHLVDLAAPPVTVLEAGGPAGAAAVVRTVSGAYSRPHLAHAAVAPSCAIAAFAGGRLDVWSHSQGIFRLAQSIALVLGLDAADVRVRHVEGPGCYGHNGADDVALDAAILARAVPGSPVRVQWTRDDEFAWEPLGSAMLIRLEADLGPDGTVVHWRHDGWSHGHDGRPSPADAPASRLLAARHLARPFPVVPARPPRTPSSGAQRNAIPGYRFDRVTVRDHYVPDEPLRVSSLRALGAHANVFAIESFVDEVALALGRDPIEFRLAHLDDPRSRAVIQAVAAMPPAMTGPGGDRLRGRGLGYARYKNDAAYVAVIAEVDLGHDIRVSHVWAAIDAGMVVSRGGLENQAEGGVLQAVSWTLVERFVATSTRIESRDWSTYPVMTFADAPTVDVLLVDRPDEPPVGAGEAMAGPTSAAIANAIAEASGVRLRDLPLTRASFVAALG